MTKATKIDRHMADQILGMYIRGDRQVDIAMWWGISPSTVNKTIQRGKLTVVHRKFDEAELPPKGPYVIRPTAEVHAAQLQARAKEYLIAELRNLLLKYENATG